MSMRVKTEVDGKTKDVAVENVTPGNYIVPENEKHLYHCVIELRKYDSESGKRLSVPRIQKFGKKIYENIVASDLRKQGYTVILLHNPADYIKAQAEAKRKANEEERAAAKKAQEEALEKAAEENQKKIDEAVQKALKAQAEANEKAIAKAVADALAKATKVSSKTSAKAEGAE